MELAPAAYLVAVKRLSLLLSVLLGGLWLKERPFLPRIIGAGLDVRRGGAHCLAGLGNWERIGQGLFVSGHLQSPLPSPLP